MTMGEEKLWGLYRSMTLDQPQELHAAFSADRDDALARGQQDTVRFCDNRLALLDDEITRRLESNVTPTPLVPAVDAHAIAEELVAGGCSVAVDPTLAAFLGVLDGWVSQSKAMRIWRDADGMHIELHAPDVGHPVGTPLRFDGPHLSSCVAAIFSHPPVKPDCARCNDTGWQPVDLPEPPHWIETEPCTCSAGDAIREAARAKRSR